MAGKEEYRVFVGGLSRNISERELENAFSRFGRVIESQIMLERDTGRSRGFGFITFTDRRGMDDAIREMHGLEFGDKIISVNKAQPRAGQDDVDYGYKGGYSSGGRGSHGIGNRSVAQDECFKCGRPGHWARDCPSGSWVGGGGGGSYTSRSRYGEDDGRGDRFGGRSQFFNDHFHGRHFGDRDRYDSKDNKYGSHDRYVGDRYSSGGDRLASNKYGEYDQYSNVHAKDRNYDRAGSPRGGADMYGIGRIARDEGRSYKSRPGPYDRPYRGGKPSSYERY